MSKKNPYRVAESVLVKLGDAVAIAVSVLALGVFLVWIVVLCLERGWGWWTLLLIPGIPAAVAMIVLAVALLWWAFGTIEDKWRDAKYRWEDEHHGRGDE